MCCHRYDLLTSTKTIRLIGDWEKGRRGYEGAGRGKYLSLHLHHRNDSCIKTGSDSDGSHFNVLLIVKDKATRQCPQTTTFEERGEPKRNRTEVFLRCLTARPNRLTMSILKDFSVLTQAC